MSHCVAIPAAVKAPLRLALDALAEMLSDYHYSAHAATRIVAYVAAEGTLAGCPELHAEDEPVMEMTYVENQVPVPFDAPAWGEPDDDGPDTGYGQAPDEN